MKTEHFRLWSCCHSSNCQWHFNMRSITLFPNIVFL